MEALLGYTRALVAVVLFLAFSTPLAIGQDFYANQMAVGQVVNGQMTVGQNSPDQVIAGGYPNFQPQVNFAATSSVGQTLPTPYGSGASQFADASQAGNVFKVDAESQLNLPDTQNVPVGQFRGSDYQTINFYVQAGSPQLAQRVGEAAEVFRRQLAIQWIGHELPNWEQPCPIRVELSNQAHGETSFMLPENGMPSDWEMTIYGPVDRLLDSVLPHEITHTIFASHFKQRLPRWLDEGSCTMVEHESEKQKIHTMLLQFLSPQERQGLPFNRMIILREYPVDSKGMLALYAQGFSVAKFLIAQGGYQHFAKFIGAGLDNERRMDGIPAWTDAVGRFYQYENLSDLQVQWLQWVQDGSHEAVATARFQQLTSENINPIQLASADGPAGNSAGNIGPVERPSAVGMLRGTEDSLSGQDFYQRLSQSRNQLPSNQQHAFEPAIQPAQLPTGQRTEHSPGPLNDSNSNTVLNQPPVDQIPNRDHSFANGSNPVPSNATLPPRQNLTQSHSLDSNSREDSTMLLPIQRPKVR